MEHLLRKAQERGHVGCSQQGYRGGDAQAHWNSITTPCALNTGHGTTEFNACPAGFPSLVPLLISMLPISPVWNRNVYSVSLYVGSM
jgi:hypothetical protein